jgi:hypothetical protein
MPDRPLVENLAGATHRPEASEPSFEGSGSQTSCSPTPVQDRDRVTLVNVRCQDA